MYMQVTPLMYVIVCPLVFLASLIDSIGGGGGLISLPAYLLAGLSPEMAAGSNKLSACIGSLTATVKYLKSKKVLLMPALMAVLGALPGAYAGAEALKHTDEAVIKIIMVVLIPLVAVFVAFRTPKGDAQPKPITRKTLMLCALSGLTVGFYDGFFGPGAGTFYILLFTWLCGMDMVTASGTAKPVNFASNVASLASFIVGGHVLYALALPAMAFSALGGYIGSKLALKRGTRFIRLTMLAVMALIIVKLVVEWFT